MKVYDYGNIEKCFISGNIKTNVAMFLKRILQDFILNENEIAALKIKTPNIPFRRSLLGKKYGDSVIIVGMSNYFMGQSHKECLAKLSQYNDIFQRYNCHILFRRSSDNPSFYKDYPINLSNIKTLDDYALIKTKKLNLLSIGGSVSIDRSWKIKQRETISKNLYWENESPYFDKDEFEKVLNEEYCACVISSEFPLIKENNVDTLISNPWVKNDEKIINDIKEETKVMQTIYNSLSENNKKPYLWFNPQYKYQHSSIFEGTFFNVLSDMQMNEVIQTINFTFPLNIGKNDKILSYDPKILENMSSKKDTVASILGTYNSPVLNHTLRYIENAPNLLEEIDEMELDDAPREGMDRFDVLNDFNADNADRQMNGNFREYLNNIELGEEILPF